MQHCPHNDKPFYHFSFLKDIKINGIYYNSFSRYLSIYPFIRKEHFHDFYSIILFTNGNSTIRIKNNTYTVQPQSICLIAPNESHSFEGLEEMDGIIFFFCQDFYVEEFSFIRLLNIFSCTSQIMGSICNPCISLSDSEFSQVNGIIKSIDQEYQSYTSLNNSHVIIRSLLNIMLLRLSAFFDAQSEKPNEGDIVFIHELSRLIDSYFIKEHHIGFYTQPLISPKNC